MNSSRPGTENYSIHFLEPQHAPLMAQAYARNRAHLAPWEPVRDEQFYSVAGQRAHLSDRVQIMKSGAGYSFGVFDHSQILGSFNLNGIVRGALQSAALGYWIDKDHTGRGIATWAVNHLKEFALNELGLHRLEAATLPNNLASQKVLNKAGFTQYGMAEKYLHINGKWRDHNLYQVLLHDKN